MAAPARDGPTTNTDLAKSTRAHAPMVMLNDWSGLVQVVGAIFGDLARLQYQQMIQPDHLFEQRAVWPRESAEKKLVAAVKTGC